MLKYLGIAIAAVFSFLTYNTVQAAPTNLKIQLEAKDRQVQPTVRSTIAQTPQPRRPIRRRSTVPCPACGMG
jgi:hypothetical protein